LISPFVLPLVLFAAPPQISPTGTEAPLAASAPAVPPVEVEAKGQPPSSTSAEAPPAAGDVPPELSDPLVDPATQPKLEAQPKAPRHYPGDPLEGFNRRMFKIQLGLDKSIYRPLAMGYQHVVPKPARAGLRNFLRNLSEPVVFLNDLLQLKPGRAARTLARFAINSTIGVGGLLDVAASKRVNLRHRNNGFGNTLAYYGVHSGPYLFMPLIGPTTLRDFLGGPVDAAALPIVVGKPFDNWRYGVSSTVVTGLDVRAESDAELRALLAGAVDRYATLRSVWLQNRAAEVSALHSHRKAPAAPPELEDPLRDPANSSTPQQESGEARHVEGPTASPVTVTPPH
jgi:phospholipid-binding lipoprotein MlaA